MRTSIDNSCMECFDGLKLGGIVIVIILGLGHADGGIKVVVGEKWIENSVSVGLEVGWLQVAWSRLPTAEEEDLHGKCRPYLDDELTSATIMGMSFGEKTTFAAFISIVSPVSEFRILSFLFSHSDSMPTSISFL